MLIGDLRDDGYRVIDIQLLTDIRHLSRPMVSGKFTTMRELEEIDTPRKNAALVVDRDRTEGVVKPDRLAVSAISDEFRAPDLPLRISSDLHPPAEA